MNLPVYPTFICLLVSYVAAIENTVPVFILDYDQVMVHNIQVDQNPFTKLPSSDFAQIVAASAKFKVIIFLEETFSVEDISTKDKFYGTPYKNLQANLLMDKNNVKYLPSVIQPCRVLRKTFPPKEDNVFYLAQRTKLQLKDSLKYIYMYFQDGANETKADVLKRHDTIIREVIGALRAMKAGPIVAYYTGKLNPVSVNKVDFVKAPQGEAKRKGLIIQTPRVLFQLYGVYTTHQARRFYYEQQPDETHTEEKDNQHNTTFLIENFELKWQFYHHKDNWELSDLYLYEQFEQVGHVAMNVLVPHNYSYHCSEPLHILNVRDGNYLTISTVIVDAEHQFTPSGQKYNTPYYCSPLISAEALNPYVSAVALVGILMGGFLMLFGCSTYDRFDDPDGKPLLLERLH